MIQYSLQRYMTSTTNSTSRIHIYVYEIQMENIKKIKSMLMLVNLLFFEGPSKAIITSNFGTGAPLFRHEILMFLINN